MRTSLLRFLQSNLAATCVHDGLFTNNQLKLSMDPQANAQYIVVVTTIETRIIEVFPIGDHGPV